MKTLLGYWSHQLAQDIAWEALEYRVAGQSFQSLAEAAVEVHQESTGVEFTTRTGREEMVRKVAHYAEAYWPEWEANQARAASSTR